MTTFTGAAFVTRQRRPSRLTILWHYRELIWMLAWRDIRIRYKHSLLGMVWAVVPPLAMMLIFTFVFGTVMDLDRAKLTGDAALPYSLFAFSGLVPWTFFASGLTTAIGSLVSNRALVEKIYFPREVFPIAAVTGAFVDFVIASATLVGFAVYLRFASAGWSYQFHVSALALPVVVVVQIVLMLGLGLLLSMANLFYRDVGFLFRTIIQLWMFVTCVVYQLQPSVGWKRAVIQLNPMTPIIQAYRDCLLLGRWPWSFEFGHAAAVSVAVLLVGWWWFRRLEFEFAENI